jgi:sulfur-carrier protein
MKVLYFAWVKARIGLAEEVVAPPLEVGTVSALIDWLRARGGGYADALSTSGVVRAAVNQRFVPLDHAISTSDEVAFFPPVTGG